MSNLIKLDPRRLAPRHLPAFKRQPGSSLLGLALDGSRLEGVAVRRTNGSVEVKKSFSVSLSLEPLTNAPELVGREIRKHLDAAGIRERRCAVCVPLNWALTLTVKLPDLPPEDLDSFLQIEAERGFPYGPEALLVQRSLFRTPGGDRYATLVAIPRDHPYRYETFPPILQDIQMDPELEMERDFVTLFVALFALLHTDADNGDRFPLLEWLKFRHFVGDALVLDEPTRVEVLTHARRYLLRGEGAPQEEALRLSIDAMDQMSWEQFTGFQYLNLIRSASKNGLDLDQVTPEIENWSDFKRRLERRSKGESEIVVNRFRPMCAQSGCNNANIRLPGMSQIGNLIPCICPACGTALIPDLLNEVANHHGH